MQLTQIQVQHFRTAGYVVLEEALAAPMVGRLRALCDDLIAQMREAMDARGGAAGINRSDRRYFVAGTHRLEEFLNDFVYGDLMAAICRALLGPDALLIWEQFMARRGGEGMRFSWHQDSGYVAGDHDPFISCYCALDDMDLGGGALHLLPYRDGVVPGRVDHLNGEVGYEGDDPGLAVEMAAGSIAVYSSRVLHRCSASAASRPQRVFLAQYAAQPLPGGGEDTWPARYESLWRAGQRVLLPPWDLGADAAPEEG